MPLTSPQGVLSILGHGVGFIQDDELEAFPRKRGGFGAGEGGAGMFVPSLTPGKPFLHPHPPCLLGAFPPAPARCPPRGLPNPLPNPSARAGGCQRDGELWEAQPHRVLKDGPGAGEAQDGPSDDVDAAVIGGVELEGDGVETYPSIPIHPIPSFPFPTHPISPCPTPSHPLPAHLQHHGAEFPLPVQLPGTGQDGGCLPGAGRPIEEQMREPILADEALHCGITG